MRNPLFLNGAVRSVEWQDLRDLSVFQSVRAVFLSAPWLAASLALASNGYYVAALPFSAVFFMAGLRQTHDGFHAKLGLAASWTNAFLVLFSLLTVIPLHAVRWIHLRHHANPHGEKDVEGMCAGMSWWMALIAGPYFSFRMVAEALRHSTNGSRNWILAEIAGILGLIGLAETFDAGWVRYQVIVMLLGNCLTGFVAVWMVHRQCDREGLFARTQRSWLINLLTLNNFYHLEHHLFPAVASCNLPELARRLDKVLPIAAPVLGLPKAEPDESCAAPGSE
jgi:fatty acid desaturase